MVVVRSMYNAARKMDSNPKLLILSERERHYKKPSELSFRRYFSSKIHRGKYTMISKVSSFIFHFQKRPLQPTFVDIIRESDDCVIVITHFQFTFFYFFRSLSSASWPPSPTAPPNPRPKCPLPLLFLRQFPFHPTVNKP